MYVASLYLQVSLFSLHSSCKLSLFSNQAPFDVLLTRRRTRTCVKYFGVVCSHICHVNQFRDVCCINHCRVSLRHGLRCCLCLTELCWLGEASPRGRTGRVMMSASLSTVPCLLKWTFLRDNPGEILLNLPIYFKGVHSHYLLTECSCLGELSL